MMGGGGGSGYGGPGGYTSVPTRGETPPIDQRSSIGRTSSPANAVPSKPAFKGSGMKLGKKSKQTEDFLDEMS